MKIYKSKYGWSTTAHGRAIDGAKIENFLDCGFKKGAEPKGEEMEGELIFREKSGAERNCFITTYVKRDGAKACKLVLMDTDIIPYEEHLKEVDTHKSDTTVSLEPDDLPFY